MKVDDHGCFYADARVLKANLFPLLLDSIREADLLRWMTECQKAGMIVLYENSSKKYLQIIDFRQRLDKARSKHPLPSVNDFPETVNEFPVELEVERKLKTEVEHECAVAQIYSDDEKVSFKNFELFIHNKAPKVARMQVPFTIPEYLKIKSQFDTGYIKDLLQKMHNYKPLLSKNVSAYLTFLNWSKNNFDGGKVIPLTSGPSPAEIHAQKIFNEVNQADGSH
jgi:hypothetical protein